MAVQYVHYKGIKFPPGYNSVENLCFAENEFEVQDDDIFNVTYPKSGRSGIPAQESGGEWDFKTERHSTFV